VKLLELFQKKDIEQFVTEQVDLFADGYAYDMVYPQKLIETLAAVEYEHNTAEMGRKGRSYGAT
jgi:hypothetical protein